MALALDLILISLNIIGVTHQSAKPELLEVRKIWDKAPHNAFTDLTFFKGRWYCTFREAKSHASYGDDGNIRVIASPDGESWTSVAYFPSPIAELPDLRDPKLVVTSDNRLMLNSVAALLKYAQIRHQSLAWFSSNGKDWSEPVKIGEPNIWIWRVSWHKGVAYGVGYAQAGSKPRDEKRFTRFYRSSDGVNFETVVGTLFEADYPNRASETRLIFLDDDTCLCILRRDGEDNTAQLGTAKPPYKEWDWKDLGVRLGGPNMIRLPDGRFVVAGRVHNNGPRTALLWLDPESGTLTEFLKLPSGGDTSYAGMVLHDGLLWMSYYSSHEGKTSIYLAKIKL